MENDINIIHLRGWHGTSEENAENILKTGFKEGEGADLWFGSGVYFFTEGIGDPKEHAKNWTIAEAHEREHTRYAVIKAGIAVNEEAILDLRQAKGLELFNQHRRYLLGQIRRSNKAFRNPSEEYSDVKVFEHLKQTADLEVVIDNVFVKFRQDRIEKIRSRIPNCTFLCVSNPSDNIDSDTLEIVDRGNV